MRLPRPVKDIRTINALLTGAETEARQAGEAVPGPEHLLLSALALPDGSARRAFRRVGADPDRLRSAIESAHASALQSIGITSGDGELDPGAGEPMPAPKGVMRTTASAQEAFQAAVKLSKATKAGRLAGAHVVAAVAGLRQGTAPRALRAMGVEPDALAAAAHEEFDTTRG